MRRAAREPPAVREARVRGSGARACGWEARGESCTRARAAAERKRHARVGSRKSTINRGEGSVQACECVCAYVHVRPAAKPPGEREGRSRAMCMRARRPPSRACVHLAQAAARAPTQRVLTAVSVVCVRSTEYRRFVNATPCNFNSMPFHAERESRRHRIVTSKIYVLTERAIQTHRKSRAAWTTRCVNLTQMKFTLSPRVNHARPQIAVKRRVNL